MTLLEVCGPPAPLLQVKVKVVVCVRPPVGIEPLAAPVWLKPLSPVIVHAVELVAFQVSVEELPLPTMSGLA